LLETKQRIKKEEVEKENHFGRPERAEMHLMRHERPAAMKVGAFMLPGPSSCLIASPSRFFWLGTSIAQVRRSYMAQKAVEHRAMAFGWTSNALLHIRSAQESQP
jgi:hypothetical protein